MKKVKKEKKLKNKPKRSLKWLLDIPIIILGSIIYAAGINCFTAPNEIAPGGVGGIATVISYISGHTVGIGLIFGLINIPLIIAGFLKLGKPMMFKTLLSVAIATVCTDYLAFLFPAYVGDRIIAAVFGGVLLGTGIGIVYYRDGTTGGTDIINKLIQKVKPHLSLGFIMMMTDAAVVLISIFVYGNLESGLYAIIAIFVSTRIMDMILYGGREGKAVLIFSEKSEEIGQAIINSISRGATFLKGEGVYTHADKNVICCAVHKNEYVKLKRLVMEIDEKAFIITGTADEVLGEGFIAIDR